MHFPRSPRRHHQHHHGHSRHRLTRIAVSVFLACILLYALWAFKSLKDGVLVSTIPLSVPGSSKHTQPPAASHVGSNVEGVQPSSQMQSQQADAQQAGGTKATDTKQARADTAGASSSDTLPDSAQSNTVMNRSPVSLPTLPAQNQQEVPSAVIVLSPAARPLPLPASPVPDPSPPLSPPQAQVQQQEPQQTTQQRQQQQPATDDQALQPQASQQTMQQQQQQQPHTQQQEPQQHIPQAQQQQQQLQHTSNSTERMDSIQQTISHMMTDAGTIDADVALDPDAGEYPEDNGVDADGYEDGDDQDWDMDILDGDNEDDDAYTDNAFPDQGNNIHLQSAATHQQQQHQVEQMQEMQQQVQHMRQQVHQMQQEVLQMQGAQGAPAAPVHEDANTRNAVDLHAGAQVQAREAKEQLQPLQLVHSQPQQQAQQDKPVITTPGQLQQHEQQQRAQIVQGVHPGTTLGQQQQQQQDAAVITTPGQLQQQHDRPVITTPGQLQQQQQQEAAQQASGGRSHVQVGGPNQQTRSHASSVLQLPQPQGAPGEVQLPDAQQGRSVGTQMVLHTSGATLYSWGLREARLARTGGDNSVPEPALPDLKVISIAASRHSAVATSEGYVWTMGHNDSRGGGGHGSPPMDAAGQLGRQGTTAPGRVMGDLQGKFVVQVITGRYHTMAVTADGELYTWGLNDWGQLGRQGTIGTLSERAARRAGPGGFSESVTGGPLGAACTRGAACHDGAPGRVTAFDGKRVVAASAGRYNCLALDDTGQLWSWGLDGCATAGQVPQQADAWRPRPVGGNLTGKRVVAFDSGYVLWMALTEEGDVYTCNTQDDGYAGTLAKKRTANLAGELGRDTDPITPGNVEALSGMRVVAVAAGREHAVVATREGHVYTWGGRELVCGRSGNLRQPGRVMGDLAGDQIIHVAAGEYFSLAASATQIYGWGGNGYLSVGVARDSPTQQTPPGKERGADVPLPTRVGGPLAQGAGHVHALVAGFQHSMAIVSSHPTARALGQQQQQDIAIITTPGQLRQHEQQQQDRNVMATPRQPQYGQQQDVAVATTPSQQQQQGTPVITTPGQLQQYEQQQQGMPYVQGTQPVTTPGQVQQYEQQTTAVHQADVTHLQAGAVNDGFATGGAEMDHIQYARVQAQSPNQHVTDIWENYKGAPNHDAIVALAPDIFKALPPKFERKFRNPCWNNGTHLRCLPYFHIIGVSKCGTTDLYHRLSKHPHMFESINKGPHYYDECTYPYKHRCAAPFDGSFEGYIDLYDRAAKAIEVTPEGITGEASSNTFTAAMGVYLRGPQWDRDTQGINITDLLYEHSPWLRLILMLRDPVSRYYSAYYYYRRWQHAEGKPLPSAEDFHRDTVAELEVWGQCVRTHSHAYCLRHYHPQQLVKGMYSEFLGDWTRVFPRSQLLVLRNEDYKAAQQQHMAVVFDFLGMRQPNAEEWPRISSMPAANTFSSKREGMKPETRALLEQFYEPYNKRLAQLLQDDRWLWRDSRQT